MKILFVVIIAATGLIIIYGSPMTKEKPVRGYYYESPAPILPMTFAHADHPTENCIDCHHNYNDDTGGGPCMNCHTTAGIVVSNFYLDAWYQAGLFVLISLAVCLGRVYWIKLGQIAIVSPAVYLSVSAILIVAFAGLRNLPA